MPKVNYRFQRRAWEQLQRRLLGKTLLFTDQAGWSDAELVRGYRAQHHVESAFRQLKDSDCIAIRAPAIPLDRIRRSRCMCSAACWR